MGYIYSMSHVTPEYLTLQSKVLCMIEELKPQFLGNIEFTISDESYERAARLLEHGQRLKYGQVINPILNPRTEIATDLPPNVVYFSNSDGQRIGEIHLKSEALEVKVLQDSFQPYANQISAKYG